MSQLKIAASLGAVVVLSAVVPGRLFGQPGQPTAEQVVARMQSFYNTTNDYQAEFYQTYFNRLFNNYQRSHGKVFFKKPGRMRWEYSTPERKLFVSDGRTLWAYEPSANQAFEQSLSSSQLPTALSFLTGQGNLATEFNFRLIPSSNYGFTDGYVVELRPKTPNAQYERLVFFVSGQNYQVIRTLVIDQAGNRNKMEFTGPQLNVGVPDGRFRFEPPRGTRIIRPGN